MTNLRQGPIRSRKYLSAAKGQPCQFRFVGICLDPLGQGHETTVFAHFRHGKGMGHKAHDFDGADGCAACHRFLDEGWPGKISQTVLLGHMLKALERTLENRIRRGIIIFPITIEQPRAAAPVKPRKPPADRTKIHSRTDWPKSRKLQSRSFPQKEKA